MAQALLITTKDVKRYTSMSGNLDEDKLLHFIEIAQDIHLKNYLGSDLLARLEEGVINSDLTADETSLLNNYVKQMLIHWAMVEYLPHASIEISNKGVHRPTSETGETVTREDIDYMIEKETNIAMGYTAHFVTYMTYNASLFPEYTSNTNDDTHPSKDTNFTNWVL
jgi:hypothetical protein